MFRVEQNVFSHYMKMALRNAKVTIDEDMAIEIDTVISGLEDEIERAISDAVEDAKDDMRREFEDLVEELRMELG